MATKTTPSVSYKKLLLEAKELRGKSGLAAHRRATILVSLFDDADFRADIGASDDFVVESFLDELVEDLVLKFLELRAMLAEFPDSSDWNDGKLATLYAKAEERIRTRKPERETPARSVTRVTREQYDALKAEKQDAEARLAFVERQSTQATSALSKLQQENQELRLENERLKGRIEELERLVGRKAA